MPPTHPPHPPKKKIHVASEKWSHCETVALWNNLVTKTSSTCSIHRSLRCHWKPDYQGSSLSLVLWLFSWYRAFAMCIRTNIQDSVMVGIVWHHLANISWIIAIIINKHLINGVIYPKSCRNTSYLMDFIITLIFSGASVAEKMRSSHWKRNTVEMWRYAIYMQIYDVILRMMLLLPVCCCLNSWRFITAVLQHISNAHNALRSTCITSRAPL